MQTRAVTKQNFLIYQGRDRVGKILARLCQLGTRQRAWRGIAVVDTVKQRSRIAAATSNRMPEPERDKMTLADGRETYLVEAVERRQIRMLKIAWGMSRSSRWTV